MEHSQVEKPEIKSNFMDVPIGKDREELKLYSAWT